MKKTNAVATTIVAAVAAVSASAAESASATPVNYPEKYHMEQAVYSAPDGGKLYYCRGRFGDWNAPGKAAVVLFFHGAGERGSDNAIQLVHGCRELSEYCSKRSGKTLLLFPQCPSGEQWVDTPWNLTEHKLPPESKAMKLAQAMLDSELKSPEIDRSRVYVAGISMGGYGGWDALSRYPGKFAAAFLVCGGVDTDQVSKFKDVPILVYHGDSDTTVPTVRSRNAVAALKAAGAKYVKYVEVPNCGHGSWGPAFAEKANWDWLFSCSR